MAIHSPTTSVHGRDLALSFDNVLLAQKGYCAGYPGSQIFYPSPTRSVMFDDFNGGAQAFSTTITEKWRSRKGSDGACVDWTTGTGAGGFAVGTIGSTTATMAVSGTQLDAGRNWQCDQGDLYFEARVKTDTIATISIFIGFTDQVAALEMPIHSAVSANTLTTNATDAVGFMFDTSMTAGTKWWLTGVANDVDATAQNTTISAGTAFRTFGISLSALGVATFYFGALGQSIQVGTVMTGAITPSVSLTPVIAGFNRTTSGTPALTVDYVGIAQLR